MSPREEECLVAERDFDSIFSYTAGIVRSRFLTELRDNKRFVGTKCGRCNTVWLPARSSCAKCFDALNTFVEVADVGTITTFTVIENDEAYYVMKPSFVLAIIQLDGADTHFVHFIGEVEPGEVKIGMKVRAIFNEERKGSVLDVKYFKRL